MVVGDKFVVTENIVESFISKFLNEGDIVEIKNVIKDELVSFEIVEENEHTNITMGFTVDIETFNKCFRSVNNDIRDSYNDIVALVEKIMEDSEFETITMFDSVTVVFCRLPNGFVIVVDDSDMKYYGDYDKEHAEEICFDKIADKILELEAYRIASIGNCDYCYCDEDNCDEGCEDEDNDENCYGCEVHDCFNHPCNVSH